MDVVSGQDWVPKSHHAFPAASILIDFISELKRVLLKD